MNLQDRHLEAGKKWYTQKVHTGMKETTMVCCILYMQLPLVGDKVRSLYVVRNNVEHLCNSNLLLYYINPNMYK